METPKIFESEYSFCQILWAHEPVKSRELVALCAEHLGWKPTTTYTVIKRLSERGAARQALRRLAARVRRRVYKVEPRERQRA